jgi:hypothetical protein
VVPFKQQSLYNEMSLEVWEFGTIARETYEINLGKIHRYEIH